MSVFEGIILPKVIYETVSDYNGKIQVLEKKGQLSLRVGGFTQSVCKDTTTAKSRVWGRAIQVLKKEEPGLGKIMVMGLGGGTMQNLISMEFPKANIVSVEIDSVMVDVAKKYFGIGEIPNHRIIVDDACRVIIAPEKYDIETASFDAIIVDIFVGDKFPELGSSGNFLAAVKKLVRPAGLVVFNRIYLSRHQDEVNNFIKTLENFFSNIKTEIVAGHTNSDNVLIYARV